MKKNYAYLSLLFVSIFTFSCSLVDHPLPPTPDVYVAGYELTGEKHAAKYWKNGQAIELESELFPVNDELRANGIAVSGNDVHVVGYTVNYGGPMVGRYWKNGVITEPWKGAAPKRLHDVLLSGKDIYMTGSTQIGQKVVPAYWKNGEAVILNDTISGDAEGIYISGNDVYVVGTISTSFNTAVYWKNGVLVNLSKGNYNTLGFSIAVSGNDVHVAGFADIAQKGFARYWKNGVETELTGNNQSLTEDIAISGSDIYISGSEQINGNYMARLWKNGIPEPISGIFANGIALANNDVYLAVRNIESNRPIAQYWKNNVAVNVANGPGRNYPTSIFVTNP